jgi:hypothetical protein
LRISSEGEDRSPTVGWAARKFDDDEDDDEDETSLDVGYSDEPPKSPALAQWPVEPVASPPNDDDGGDDDDDNVDNGRAEFGGVSGFFEG